MYLRVGKIDKAAELMLFLLTVNPADGSYAFVALLDLRLPRYDSAYKVTTAVLVFLLMTGEILNYFFINFAFAYSSEMNYYPSSNPNMTTIRIGI